MIKYDHKKHEPKKDKMKHPRKKTANTIDRAYKGVLFPDQEQSILIEKTIGCCRFVYNKFLDERIKAYKSNGETLSYTKQCARLPLMKESPETEWLKEVDSTALQNKVRDLQDAFDRFFQKRAKYPKFKKKHQHRQSYRSQCINNNIRLVCSNMIQLPKLGEVKCMFPRIPEGRILNATIIREADGTYEITVNCESPRPEALPGTGKAVGIDLGIRTLAVTSDGKEYGNPRTYRKNRKKLARAQKKLSRKSKDSKNREKQRIKAAKIHKKIRNQRLDAIHKMTHELIREYDVICMEDLDIREMKNTGFAKDLSDAAFGEIHRQLVYKSDWYGKQLITTDRYYPSSQICSSCQTVNPEIKDLKVRRWKCPVCGAIHDRDLNAAKNILSEGLKKLST